MKARGYSLPFVILILVILSVALASLMFVLTAGARSTESMLGRRKLFYACDGLSRIAAVSAQEYFGQTATPSSSDLKDFVCAAGGGCVAGSPMLPTMTSQSPGFQISDFRIATLGGRSEGQLDSGPFTGMSALIDSVAMGITGNKPTVGWACDVEQELSLAKISMFQFFIFSDQPYTDWLPGPKMAGDGRVHANGDLCLFALNGLYVDRVTAAERVSPGKFNGGTDTTICRNGSYNDFSANLGPKIAKVDAPVFDTNTGNTNPVEPNEAHFSLFSNRPSTKAAWLTASAIFDGHLMDRDHGVQKLRLPILGTPAVQKGRDAAIAVTDNDGTSRLLVDPVFAGDTSDVRSQKFAFKADIRIINGVWYVRNPNAPEIIGTPVWSDHPGNFTTTGESGVEPASVAVGQSDLALSSARNWGTATPKRFSYYRFNGTKLERTGSDPTAVVSYGVLHKTAGTPSTWQPGVRCQAVTKVETALATTDATCNLASGTDTVARRLLRSTRGGIRDGHAQNRFGATSNNANVLPMNLDLAALQNALNDCTAGELGSYFPGTCDPATSPDVNGRPFNGVLYVTNTWPNSNAVTPAAPPAQGGRGGGGGLSVTLGGVTANAEQGALPEPLCTSTPALLTGGVAITGGSGSVTTGINFPDCATYRGTNIPNDASVRGARATSIRLYNARNLNNIATGATGRPTLDRLGVLENGVGKTGLTVASNLPVYVLGDANSGSDGFGDENSTPWVPFLVAGDVVSLLSNNWNDARSQWTFNLSGTPRTPTESTYNLAILAGWTPTTSSAFSGGLHNFPRFLENWNDVDLHIRGSLVVGWAAVYAQWTRHCCNATSYNPPDRDWGFDRHLKNILNQPPGAPLFDVQATRRWKR